MTLTSILGCDGKDELPLLEQASESLQQRVVTVIDTRSLGRSGVQLENQEPFTMPKFFDRTEANVIATFEAAKPRSRLLLTFRAFPTRTALQEQRLTRCLPCLRRPAYYY